MGMRMKMKIKPSHHCMVRSLVRSERVCCIQIIFDDLEYLTVLYFNVCYFQVEHRSELSGRVPLRGVQNRLMIVSISYLILLSRHTTFPLAEAGRCS